MEQNGTGSNRRICIFHQKVRNGYLELAEKEPERFLVLDASKPLEEVIEEFYERFWLVEVAR